MRQLRFFVFLFLWQSGFSQNYSIREFGAKDGLSDSYVYALVQDNTGYLYVATGKSLQRFDGQYFSEVKSKKAEDELVYSAVLTHDNKLWFGSFNGKLYSYEQNTNSLRQFSQEVNASVSKMIALKNSGGFCVFSKGNGVFITNGKNLTQIKGSENMQINALERLNDGLFLAAGDDGLYTLNCLTQEIKKLKGLSDELKTIQRTPSGILYIHGIHSGILEVEIGENDSLKIINQITNALHIDGETITNFFFVESRSQLFISTQDEHLQIVNTQKASVTKIREEDFLSAVSGFYFDHEENLWIATPGKGLFRFTRTNYDYIESEGKPVYAITQDKEGRTYLGLQDGILIKDASGGSSKKISSLKGRDLGKITSLFCDTKKVWVGTESNGLFILNINTETIQIKELSKQQNLCINSITSRAQTIVVTTNLDGVFIFENDTLKNHFSVENGLVHNNVYYALISKKGLIFYATHNSSFNYSQGDELFEIDVKGGGLNSDFNSFAEDSAGNVYIATQGDAIYMLNNKSIKIFECDKKLESLYCHGLLVDKNGQLWIMQSDHLYVCRLKSKVLKKQEFTMKKPLHFNSNAFFMNNWGDVYFGTDQNAVLFHAGSKSDKLPQVYLTRCLLNDSLIQLSNNQLFPYGNYDIEFEISAICLKNSEAITFSYILEGRDKDWSEQGHQRKLSYSKLSEGDYSLKVRAFNSEGFSLEEEFIVHFTIRAPFWKSLVFWIIILIALAVFVFMIIHLRTRHLVVLKKNLEKLVDEKTKELREEKERVLESRKLIQEQNEEIKDSITYAKRIQEALLTDKTLIHQHNKNLFVFYQPRDIVSGDFYWMAELAHLKIVVAADCTGHGVPGALMSMVGSTLLNKIINEKQLVQPKDILEALDEEVKSTLKQYSDSATRDGMDVCLCCIDEKKGILTYAGAMRPLYLIRDGQLREFSPTKYAIGGYGYGNKKLFEQTVIKIKKNDHFYLFSDGYADQFGGDKGKKLMLKNFKTFLLSIALLEMNQQKEKLEEHYNSWKGEHSQIDDVLVIGIRT